MTFFKELNTRKVYRTHPQSITVQFCGNPEQVDFTNLKATCTPSIGYTPIGDLRTAKQMTIVDRLQLINTVKEQAKKIGYTPIK